MDLPNNISENVETNIGFADENVELIFSHEDTLIECGEIEQTVSSVPQPKKRGTPFGKQQSKKAVEKGTKMGKFYN